MPRAVPLSPLDSDDVPSALARRGTPRARALVRALGINEALFLAFGRFTATNVARVIAVEGVLAPATLAAALPVLAARHPLLEVQIADGPHPVFVRSEHSVAIALHVVARNDGMQWRTLLERLLNEPLEGPLLHLHYVHTPGQRRAELIVVGHHAICDGISLNALCAELLALCAGATPEPARPSVPALTALLPRFGALQRTASIVRTFARFARIALGRRLFERPRSGATTRFVTRALGLTASRALVERARAEGTTVTGALMAAVLTAIESSRVTSPDLALSLPVNLRPHLTEHTLTADDLGNYTNVAYLRASRGGELWPRARALKAKLAVVTRPSTLLGALETIYRAGHWIVGRGRPGLAHALISNSGIVPLAHDYGAFRPVDFYSGTSAAMLSADFSFFCNTLDGRLRLNLVFLEEVVARDEAQRVLDEVVRQLGCSRRAGQSQSALARLGAAESCSTDT